MDAEPETRLPAAAADIVDLLHRRAFDDVNLVVDSVGHVKVLLLGILREGDIEHRPVGPGLLLNEGFADKRSVRLEDREYRAQYEQANSSYDAAAARLSELERGSRPEEIDRAKAEVERAQADLQTADAQLKRIQGLVREGVSPAQLLDDAKGRYDSARANLSSLTKTYELIKQGPRQEQIQNARSEVGRAKEAVDYAETILDATEIRVPSNGTILERNVERILLRVNDPITKSPFATNVPGSPAVRSEQVVPPRVGGHRRV